MNTSSGMSWKQLLTIPFVFAFLLLALPAFAQPDLYVPSATIANSLQVDYISNNDQCFINEGCVSGTGARQLIRFTTRIDNIGNQDFYVGRPPASQTAEDPQWEWDECHAHWHYEGYARYVVKDAEGNQLPASFKNGFCLMDITCTSGQAKFDCNNQGITAGCADVYTSGLDCQWIDVTDLPAGNYELSVEVNWDQTADAYGNAESNFDNNTGTVCFTLNRSGDQIAANVINCADIGNETGTTGCTESEYKLQFTFDNYPEETTFNVQDANGNSMAVGGPYGSFRDGSTHEEAICLPEGCYQLTISDTYGDGICCGYGNGDYQLLDPAGNVVASGGQFGTTVNHDFCVNTQPVEPPPTTGPCPGNVLPDPGFEESNLVGWEILGNVRRVQNAHEGTYGARLRSGEARMSYTVNVSPGDAIDFCGYLKSRRRPTAARIGINWLDGSFQTISTVSEDVNSRNYTEYCVSSTAPAQAIFARVFVYQNGTNSRLFVDNLCLEGSISNRSEATNANFLELDVQKKERAVTINWTAISKGHVRKYVIERSSDNINFDPILSYPVNQQSDVAVQYEMVDTDPLRGTNYYRVRQILTGNSSTNSTTRRVEFQFDLTTVTIFPNPAKERLLVDLRVLSGKKCQLMISDNLGVVRSSQTLESIPQNMHPINLENFAPGVYRLSILVDSRRILTKSFVVIKE